MGSKELFGLRLKYLPGWIGNDDIETPALVHHVWKFVAPVKRVQGLYILNGQRPLYRFALTLFCAIPGRLLIFHAKPVELIEQYAVEKRRIPFRYILTELQQPDQCIASPDIKIDGCQGLYLASILRR